MFSFIVLSHYGILFQETLRGIYDFMIDGCAPLGLKRYLPACKFLGSGTWGRVRDFVLGVGEGPFVFDNMSHINLS